MQLYSYLFSIPEINQIIINQINQENMGFQQLNYGASSKFLKLISF
ncbi:hypothetical protein pb186bvf_004389 [Paramecium bursaria]